MIARITLSPVDFVDDVDERSIGLTTALPIIKIGRSSKSQAKNFVPGRDNAWIDSAVMSRDHAMIRWSESLVNPLFIEDMGSMHGTYLNGRKVHSGEPHALNDGDLVTFGFEVTRASETFPARSFRVHFESKASTHQPTPPTSSYSVPEASEDESDSREPEAVDSSLKRQSADERATTKSSVSNCAVRGDASDSEDEPRVFTVPDSENSSSAGSLFEEGEDELTHHHFDQLPTLARKVTTRSEVADVDDIPASQPSDAAALETDDDERYGVMPALIDIPSSPPSSAELKQPYGPCSWGSHQKPMKIEDSEEEQPEECPTRTVIEVAVPDTIHKSWSRGINRQPEIHEQGSEPDHSDGGRSYQYTDLDDDDDEEADGDVAISDILEPDMPCPAPVASAKRKAEALDDHTKISFAPVRPEHISAPPSPGYALDLPDAQPVDALAPESQGTSLDILEKPQHEESEASPTRKRVKTEDSRAEYNRVKGAAKVLGGAVVAGVGMFLALAAACPDQIV
ncbi:MAG: hypothetical protein M1832_002638 [Thelocarpon impressellum]|nr:MAG: hypothetical protein M1832_002638 [Thelocarpon impressellum]